jgi:aromatic ring-opening dioxygenase LigB subunit
LDDRPLIVAAAIAPHGTPAFDAGPTRDALEEIGRRFVAAAPEAIVVVTPHNVHVEGHFAVVDAATVAGSLAEWGVPERTLERSIDRGFVAALNEAAAGLPLLTASYGGNDPATAAAPMDWGTLIPLAFLPETPVVVVSPARDRPLAEHVELGRAIAAAAAGKRVALVASADHGHAHDPDGPYGFDLAAAEYDEAIVELVRTDRLDRLDELEPLAAPAKADSLWQLVVLHGALGDSYAVELLSYEAPTYFGMLCAAYAPSA